MRALIPLALLWALAAPAAAQTPHQTAMRQTAESIGLAATDAISDREQWLMAQRLIDWSAFEGVWRPPGRLPGQHWWIGALLRCEICHRFLPARDALLVLAEGLRRQPRTVMDLVYAHALAQRCGARQPSDAFAPEQADEVRGLRLLLEEVEETVSRRHARDAAILAALRDGAGERMIAGLEQAEGPGWPGRVKGLLSSDDPSRIESLLLGGASIRKMRQIRATWFGLDSRE